MKLALLGVRKSESALLFLFASKTILNFTFFAYPGSEKWTLDLQKQQGATGEKEEDKAEEKESEEAVEVLDDGEEEAKEETTAEDTTVTTMPLKCAAVTKKKAVAKKKAPQPSTEDVDAALAAGVGALSLGEDTLFQYGEENGHKFAIIPWKDPVTRQQYFILRLLTYSWVTEKDVEAKIVPPNVVHVKIHKSAAPGAFLFSSQAVDNDVRDSDKKALKEAQEAQSQAMDDGFELYKKLFPDGEEADLQVKFKMALDTLIGFFNPAVKNPQSGGFKVLAAVM